jgi:hypothetical protein
MTQESQWAHAAFLAIGNETLLQHLVSSNRTTLDSVRFHDMSMIMIKVPRGFGKGLLSPVGHALIGKINQRKRLVTIGLTLVLISSYQLLSSESLDKILLAVTWCLLFQICNVSRSCT